jgi:hypothetical protein
LEGSFSLEEKSQNCYGAREARGRALDLIVAAQADLSSDRLFAETTILLRQSKEMLSHTHRDEFLVSISLERFS